jgi:hypothetical protein
MGDVEHPGRRTLYNSCRRADGEVGEGGCEPPSCKGPDREDGLARWLPADVASV